MKKLALIALAFVALEASAQQDTLKYRINLLTEASREVSVRKGDCPPPTSTVAHRFDRFAGMSSVCGCHSRQGSENRSHRKMG